MPGESLTYAIESLAPTGDLEAFPQRGAAIEAMLSASAWLDATIETPCSEGGLADAGSTAVSPLPATVVIRGAALREDSLAGPVASLTITVPADAPFGSTVRIVRVTALGRDLLSEGDAPTTLTVSAHKDGLLAPLRLPGASVGSYTTPAIAPGGPVYMPCGEYMRVFSHDGTDLPRVSFSERYAISMPFHCASFDEVRQTLVLGCFSQTAIITCIDPGM